MKRQGNLIEKIADIDNLRLAFWKAKRGKAHKYSVMKFQEDWETHLLQIREELLSGKVTVGKYQYFITYDPKERRICAADFRERVMHHAIMNICHDRFEQVQIYDSYASRKGKGTYAALARAAVFAKKYKWFLKFDVRKFFESIPHETLKNQISRLFKDNYLLDIFGQIIDSYQGVISSDSGVPIGNLTSQYFANHYLSSADHYAQEQLKLMGYIRYMDDMVLWHNDKDKILEAGRLFEQYINEELGLVLKPLCLHETYRGVPFLGYIIYPNKIRLSHRSRFRFIQKLKKYEANLKNEDWTQEEYQRCILPLLAFVSHADSVGFRRKIIAE
jgi:RNA-directed DNA polymerase